MQKKKYTAFMLIEAVNKEMGLGLKPVEEMDQSELYDASLTVRSFVTEVPHPLYGNPVPKLKSNGKILIPEDERIETALKGISFPKTCAECQLRFTKDGQHVCCPTGLVISGETMANSRLATYPAVKL